MQLALVRFLAGLILAVLAVRTAQGDDWPMWRHDRLRTGVTGERLEPPLERIWTFRSRQARKAPAWQTSTFERLRVG